MLWSALRPTLTFKAGSAALLFVLAGCATSGPMESHSVGSRDTKKGSPCTLLVENHGFRDIHLYALRGDNTRVPLGRVSSLDERRVMLPRTVVAARYMNLVAVPAVLGEQFVSERVLLEGGTEIVWRLKNELAFSTLVVR
jgi:hypothetical protein